MIQSNGAEHINTDRDHQDFETWILPQKGQNPNVFFIEEHVIAMGQALILLDQFQGKKGGLVPVNYHLTFEKTTSSTASSERSMPLLSIASALCTGQNINLNDRPPQQLNSLTHDPACRNEIVRNEFSADIQRVQCRYTSSV